MVELGAVDVVGVEPNVATGGFLWRYGGQLRATIVAKATFELVHDQPMTLGAPDKLVTKDLHFAGSPLRSVQVASDLVPYRPRADVTFVGHACAPNGAAVPALGVRFALYRDVAVMDRALHVYGDRDPAGEVVPFERMAVAPERALASEDNPAGIKQPNLLDARGPAVHAWLGPVSRFWSPRARLLRGAKAPPLRGVFEVPKDLDWAYFQAALVEQQVSFLRGDEWVVLDGVHPTHTRLKTQLPMVRAKAMVHVDSGSELRPGRPLELVTDGLAVDGDRMAATVTFRGSFALESEAARSQVKVVVGLEVGGAHVKWPAVEALGRPRPGPLPSAEAKQSLNETRTLEQLEALDPAAAIPFRPGPPKPVEPSTEVDDVFKLTPEEERSLGARGQIDDGEPTTDGSPPDTTS